MFNFFGSKKGTKHYLLKGAIGSFLVQIIGMGLVFISSLVLANLLGTKAYGVYTYILTWVSLLGGMLVFGFDDLLIRAVASYKTQKQYAYIKGIFFTALGVMVGLSIFVMCIVYGLIEGGLSIEYAYLKELGLYKMLSQYETAFKIGLCCIPLVGVLHIYQATLLGGKHIISGQVAEGVVKPIVLLVGIGGIWWWGAINVCALIQLNVVAFVVACLLCCILFKQKFGSIFQQHSGKYKQKTWIKEAFPFFLITSVNLINIRADILMLGALVGDESTGMYKVASSLSELLRLALGVLTVVLAPLITDLYQQGKRKELQDIITKSVRLVAVLMFPVAISMMVFGKVILEWYGADFIAAYTALVILVGIQLWNVWTGVGGKLLMMTNHERPVVMALCITTVVNIFLNLALIPMYKEVGAAIATALSVIMYNVLLIGMSLFFTGIDVTIVGCLKSIFSIRKIK